MDSKVKKVLYVTSRFPALSMTFVANEMSAIEKLGVHIDVATLWKSVGTHKGHPNELPFLSRVIKTQINPVNCLQAIFFLLINPATLVTVLRLFPGHLKSPWLFAKLLVAIPKGVLLGRHAKKQKYDLIHAHFLTSPTTVAMIASRYSGIPYTCTAHAFDITSTNPRITNGSVLLKCQRAATVVTISEYNEGDIRNRWPAIAADKICVIYNGIDTTNYSADRDTPPLSDKTNTRVVCISNLNEKKGHVYLVKAVALLLGKNNNITLDLYGTGPAQAELEALIQQHNMEQNVVLHGSVNQSQTSDIIRNSDIFVLASIPMASGDADGLPTVLIEALSCATPTISTQVTGIPEIIINEKTGLCVPPNDEQAIADGIDWMINNPQQSINMGLEGRKLVEKHFDSNIAARQLLTRWENCVSTV